MEFHPLTPARWTDLAGLFGQRGACGGCWCMWFRLPRSEYEAGKGNRNRNRLKALVERGEPTGILAYMDRQPVGWCSVAPRAQHRRLTTSRTMKATDERPLWTIICLFVAPAYRRRGLTAQLIREAAKWAVGNGAPGVEAFPIIPRRPDVPTAFASQGLLSAYLEAGFALVEKRSPTRAVVEWPPPGAG
jgi:GNAT superfamily N-acetyltransferase